MRGRLDHREPGPDGTLGVVLMRLRIAEINPAFRARRPTTAAQGRIRRSELEAVAIVCPVMVRCGSGDHHVAAVALVGGFFCSERARAPFSRCDGDRG